MSKLTLTQLKQYLNGRSHDELVAEIADLWKKLDEVKDYYATRLGTGEVQVIDKYKAQIKHEFFPARGYGDARLSLARKAVTDYKKVSSSVVGLIDLMLFYVETGVRYTNAYGDINEGFYNSMAGMYERAVDLLAQHDLRDQFADRCRAIVDDTSSIGWGFHDDLSDTYRRAFGG